MNLLYISSVDGGPWAGPTYSVPNQIKAQAKIDNVFWYNIYDGSHPEWVSSEWEKLPYYADLRHYPNAKVSDLPPPFNKPDLIIIEQFYCYARLRIPRDLMNGGVPYIIVPRGELTMAAQKRKSLKKQLFNLLYYRKFAQKTAAIQYLTEQEKNDSGLRWNKKSIVVPNGVYIPLKYKKNFSCEGIKAVVIGRIEPYQKGLDLLIDACEVCKQEIEACKLTIDMYGPDRVGRLEEMKALVEKKGLDQFISFHDAVYGEEKERVLLNSDVFIIPSRFEGHPTALIEALAYGLPALVTTGANMRLEIEDNNAGWGADNNRIDLANSICRMMLDRDMFEQKGNNAKKLACEYSWDELAEKCHGLYNRLICGV